MIDFLNKLLGYYYSRPAKYFSGGVFCFVLTSGAMQLDAVREERIFELFSEVEVASRGRYLSVEIGLRSAVVRCDAALRKYNARALQIAAMPLHWCGRLFAFGMYALSVLRFVAQVAPLPQAAMTAEQGAIARLFRCPMYVHLA